MAEKTKIIEIVSYNPQWKIEFEKIKDMKYHLYVCPKDGKGYLEHIAFRDYLRANPYEMEEYKSLKIKLAQEYRFDIDTYCDKKTEFVKGILYKTIYINRSN